MNKYVQHENHMIKYKYNELLQQFHSLQMAFHELQYKLEEAEHKLEHNYECDHNHNPIHSRSDMDMDTQHSRKILSFVQNKNTELTRMIVDKNMELYHHRKFEI